MELRQIGKAGGTAHHDAIVRAARKWPLPARAKARSSHGCGHSKGRGREHV